MFIKIKFTIEKHFLMFMVRVHQDDEVYLFFVKRKLLVAASRDRDQNSFFINDPSQLS